jgi:hypothetical protein
MIHPIFSQLACSFLVRTHQVQKEKENKKEKETTPSVPQINIFF